MGIKYNYKSSKLMMPMIRAIMEKQGCCEPVCTHSPNRRTQEDFPREVTCQLSPEGCIELVQATMVKGQECF